MIVALIIACEVGFWVMLAAGLAVRYLLKRRRTSVALLLCEPLLEVVLFVVTAIDLKNGAEPSWEHGLAALYIGFTVAYGHYTIRRLDGHAAHRLAGAPPPPKPPRYGMARAGHEGKIWLRTVLAAAVACALLQAAIWYVGDGNTESLRAFQWVALRAAVIHGLIALTYLIWPKKGPTAGTERARTLTKPSPLTAKAARSTEPSSPPGNPSACRPASARPPAPTARPRPHRSPSGQG